MHDAALVCGLERSSQLTGDVERLFERQWSLCESFGEREPLDELQHEQVEPVHVLDAVNRGDVRMMNRCEHA